MTALFGRNDLVQRAVLSLVPADQDVQCLDVSITDDQLTYAVIGCARRVYNQFGYGFLESAYVCALVHACRKTGLEVERERRVPLYFDGEVVANYRTDMLVERRLIIEAKTRAELLPQDIKQTWNYLRCTDLELALLLNFGPKNLVVKRYTCRNSLKRPRSY